MTLRPGPVTISVVIPARNEAALIGATVESVRRARAEWCVGAGAERRVEILVVDNASTDGTPAVLAQLADMGDLRVLQSAELGAAHARNLGARMAAGSLLVFLDADTQVPPSAIRRFAELVEHGGFEAGITRLGSLEPGRRAWLWWSFWNLVRLLPLPRAKAMPACMFCTRAAFAEFGPFDVRVSIGEEWPLLASLYRARPHRLVYDWHTMALSSSRRMDLQPLGYTRTLIRYVWAVLSPRGRVGYPDHIRHRAKIATAEPDLAPAQAS